jgi:phosphoribosylglycinamide formyltransferase-1
MAVKIALLSYNFPHKKTQDFILRVIAEGYKIDVIYAADAVKLNITGSTIKTKINHIGLVHPRKIAENLGIDYIVIPHDSEALSEDIKSRQIDIGLITGARILKEDVINCFRLGVINFHPGVIPDARGLDALLWSIYRKDPIGVTAHLIDKRIDAGGLLEIRKINIYASDTLLDLSERLYEIQLDMIACAIAKTVANETFLLDNYGQYNRKMPSELEAQIPLLLKSYLEVYGN